MKRKLFIAFFLCAVLNHSQLWARQSESSSGFFSHHKNSRKPMSHTGFSLGPRWVLTHTPDVRDYFSFSFSQHKEVANKRAEINYRVTAGFNAKFSGGDVSATIGSNYFFLKDAVAPYVGLDFGLAFMTFNSRISKLAPLQRHAPFGFFGGPRVGARFFKKSQNQLDLSLASSFLFREVGGKMPIFLELRLALLI